VQQFIVDDSSIYFQNNGFEIKWSHLVELAELSRANSGLYIGQKLKRKHLISFNIPLKNDCSFSFTGTKYLIGH